MIYLTTNIIAGKDWLTVVFILIFVLLGTVKWLYNDRLFKLITVFFTKDYFLSYGKENKLIKNRFNIILFIIQTLIVSLFFFELLFFYKPSSIEENGLVIFLEICLIALLFFFFRGLLGQFLSFLFEIRKQQEQLSFIKMSYLYSLSLLILPLLLFTFYTKWYNFLAFQLLVVFFTILLIVRYVVIIKYNKNNASGQLFYFILYLCALEIAPLLLMYKIVANF